MLKSTKSYTTTVGRIAIAQCDFIRSMKFDKTYFRIDKVVIKQSKNC